MTAIRDWSEDKRRAFAEALENPGETVRVNHPEPSHGWGRTLETFRFDGEVVHHWFMSASAERGERHRYTAEGRRVR